MSAVTFIEAATGREAVYKACAALLERGRYVAPRGAETLELAPVVIELAEPSDTLPTGIGRAKLLPAIAAAEALQNVAGVAVPGLMSRISSFFPKPTGRWGEGVETYGPRIGPQMRDVVELLWRDAMSREAVVSIWRAGDITGGQAHNLCTTSLQFLIRGGALELYVQMRSNDAWYGLCYDLFQFAQVQLTVARCLGVPAGRYVHTATSLHLYERHWEAARALTPPAPNLKSEHHWGIGNAWQSWPQASARAVALLNGALPTAATATERWYAETLAPYAPDGG